MLHYILYSKGKVLGSHTPLSGQLTWFLGSYWTLCAGPQRAFSLTILSCRRIFPYLYFDRLGIASVGQSVGRVVDRRHNGTISRSSRVRFMGQWQYGASGRVVFQGAKLHLVRET